MEKTSTHTIRDAIKRQDVELARDLIRTELRKHPTSELYFLASRVAATDSQEEKMVKTVVVRDR